MKNIYVIIYTIICASLIFHCSDSYNLDNQPANKQIASEDLLKKIQPLDSSTVQSDLMKNTPKKEAPKKKKIEWKIVSRSGSVVFVYVSPEKIKEELFMSEILTSMAGRRDKIIELLIFDDIKFTPHNFPMSDEQMLHWKARYNYNPNTNNEEFVWIKVINPKSSPPKIKEVRANIKPAAVR